MQHHAILITMDNFYGKLFFSRSRTAREGKGDEAQSRKIILLLLLRKDKMTSFPAQLQSFFIKGIAARTERKHGARKKERILAPITFPSFTFVSLRRRRRREQSERVM